MRVQSQFIEMTTRSELNKKSIGEIAEVRTGSTPSRSNPEYWNGTHYWVSAQDMGNIYINVTSEKNSDIGHATCKVVPAGSILYVCRGSIGVMSINTMDCATNQSICTATCKTGYNTEYLYYALKVAEKAIKKQGIGTSFKSLNQSAFASIEILFPAIEIQDKFATIAKQADKSKFVGFKSQFIEMFGNPLFNTKKWECYSNINTITTIVLGSTPNTKEPKYWDGDIKWITPAEMDDETFMINDTLRHITDVGVKSATLTKLPVGTVLLSTRAPIGKVGIVAAEMYCNQGFKSFICSNQINSIFLYYTLKSNKEYLCSLGTGTTFKELSKKVVEGLKLAVPPIDLQKQFATIYKQADKSKYYN